MSDPVLSLLGEHLLSWDNRIWRFTKACLLCGDRSGAHQDHLANHGYRSNRLVAYPFIALSDPGEHRTYGVHRVSISRSAPEILDRIAPHNDGLGQVSTWRQLISLTFSLEASTSDSERDKHGFRTGRRRDVSPPSAGSSRGLCSSWKEEKR